MYLHEAFAHALVEHDVHTLFGLAGDGNLFMVDSFARIEGTSYIAAAHESTAALMAHGFASTSARLGVVTVTHGPALTNIITPLVDSTFARMPLLVIAGDTDIEDVANAQAIPQREFVLPTGAGFEQVRTMRTALGDLAVAVGRAFRERRPVVLNVPANYWWQDVEYQSIASGWIGAQASAPDPDALNLAVGMIASAKRPLVLTGRGAINSEAGAAIAAFAERIGALTANSLKAKDMFYGESFDVGILGSLATEETLEAVESTDCVIAFGAGLNNHTTAERSLLNGRTVIHVDSDPESIGRVARVDVGVVGDATIVADTLVRWLDEAEIAPTRFRADHISRLPSTAPAERFVDVSTAASVDLRTALLCVDEIVPKNRTLVVDGGRFVNFAVSMLHAPNPRAFVDSINFGSIGLGMGTAIGASLGAPGRPVLLACGDGGFMLGGVAEFNTAVRNRVDLIVAVFNDSSYGAEYVQFRQRGMDPGVSQFNWPDFAPVAIALGGEAVTVRNRGDFSAAAEMIANRKGPILIDIKMNPDHVTMPPGGH